MAVSRCGSVACTAAGNNNKTGGQFLFASGYASNLISVRGLLWLLVVGRFFRMEFSQKQCYIVLICSVYVCEYNMQLWFMYCVYVHVKVFIYIFLFKLSL